LGTVTNKERWLAAEWPFVAGCLPPSPASVLEVGCGTLGGFVPAMRTAGYDALGIDPHAPEGPAYRRSTFEEHIVDRPVDAIVACTSLHHVHDLGIFVDRAVAALVPGGTLAVVEWAWERCDEPTARWAFARLAPPGPTDEPSWLHKHRDAWTSSGRSWATYVAAWAGDEGLHRGREILSTLRQRFDTRACVDVPYLYSDLPGEARSAEQAAIDAGEIRATGVHYVGRLI
jgi:SAM-dependent methyltransferase